MKHETRHYLVWIYQSTKGKRSLLSLLAMVTIVMSVCNVMISLIIRSFIDIATKDSKLLLSQVSIIAILIIFIYAGSHILSSILHGRVYNSIEKKIRIFLIKTIFNKPILAIQERHSGEVLTRLTLDIAKIADLIPELVGSTFAEILTSILAVVMLFVLNWKMALILIVLLPLLMVIISAFSPVLQKAAATDSKNEDANRSYMQETLNHLLLLKAYSMEEKVEKGLSSRYFIKAKSKIRLSLIQGLMGFLNNFMGFCLFIVTMGVGAYFVLQGSTTIGSLIAMIQLTNYVLLPVNGITQWTAKINDAVASVKRLESLYELPDEKRDAEPTPSCADKLVLRDVSFSYKEGNEILQNVNAVFESGQVTGIIGKSGSGKSTLLRLIMGLYPSKSGEIVLLCNGIEMKNSHMLNAVAYVPSDGFLFNGTIRENILMGLPYDESAYRFAIESSNIESFVVTLDKGFDADVAESGRNFSMGQQQRIAIARALYKQAPVIIFDEPTANLDQESIRSYQEMLRRISEKHICIIVTHDPSTAAICDLVYLLDHGRMQSK